MDESTSVKDDLSKPIADRKGIRKCWENPRYFIQAS